MNQKKLDKAIDNLRAKYEYKRNVVRDHRFNCFVVRWGRRIYVKPPCSRCRLDRERYKLELKALRGE